MRKRLLAIIATAAMVVTMIPAMAFADVADTDVAKIGETGYATLQAAMNEAEDGDTVTLLATYSDWKMIQVGKKLNSVDETVTINLNGFDINRTFGGIALDVVDGTVIIKGNGSISGSADGISVAYDAALILEEGVHVEGRDGHGIDNDGELTINGATVTGNNGGYGVALYEGSLEMNSGSVSGAYGVAAYTDTEVTVNGGEISGEVAGLSGHGQYHGTVFNITGGTIESENGVGIYHPQNGELNISGGKISGATGINMKSGKLSVTGGEIYGTGAAKDYGFVGGGFNPTGDALVIESCGYPGGAPTASIEGGTFASENADAVASYAGNNVTDKVDGFISGGDFDSDIREFLADGYVILATYSGTPGEEDYEEYFWPVKEENAIEEGGAYRVEDGNGNVTYYMDSADAEVMGGVDPEDVEDYRIAYYAYFDAIDPAGKDLDDSEYGYIMVPAGKTINEALGNNKIDDPAAINGYKFVGWYTAANDEWDYDDDGNVEGLVYGEKVNMDTQLTTDVNAFAKWEKVEATAGTTTPTDAVDTGDDSNMAVPFAIAGLVLAAMAAVVATRRRYN